MTSSSDHGDSTKSPVFPVLTEPGNAAAAQPTADPPDVPGPRLHVLLVCDKPSWERIGPVIRRLAVGLIDEAVRVSLVCGPDCPASAHLPGLQAAYSLPRPGYLNIFNPTRRFDELAEYAQRAHLTCIHAVSVSCLETALAIKQVLNIPLLVTVDTLEDHLLAFLADLLGEDRVAVAMSERIKAALLARPGEPKRSQFVEVIRPGVYVQERARPPFEPGSPVSMLVLEPATRTRGFETILQAAAELLQDGINIMLFFIDTGPAETHLRKLALRLQIHEHITFTGKFTRWPQTLGAADVVILPQPQKQVHIYPLEALASGTLVVAAAGHCYDTILDGKTGLEFSPDREQDLAERLSRTLADPHLARSLAYTAQEKIRRDHSVSQMINAYIALYTRLSTARPPGAPAAR